MNDTEREDLVEEYFDTMEIAIIHGAGFGMRDFPYDNPGLWFAVSMKGQRSSLQIFHGKRMERIFRESGAYDVKDLNGMPCYVREDDGLIRFVRMAPELLK